MASGAGGSPRFGGGQIGKAERLRGDLVSHEVIGCVGGTGTMTGLAANFDRDHRPCGGVAGAVTCEAARLGLAGEAITGERVASGLPGGELLGVARATFRGAHPVAAISARLCRCDEQEDDQGPLREHGVRLPCPGALW